MASDYGRNFGFRRSDESMRVAEGRYRTPATGSTLLQGTAVEIDTANPGRLKAAAANAPLVTGVSGLLIQELAWDRSIYESPADLLDSYSLNQTKKDRLSVMTSGAGVKVWLKNTPAETRADGRSIAAVTMVTLTGLAAGDKLGWDGSKFVEVNGSTVTEAWMTVLSVDSAAGRVEAVLNA